MDRNELLAIAKPILFNTDMVVAILKNMKSETRRIARFIDGRNPNWTGYVRDGLMLYNGTNEPCIKKAPYKVGDYLYVRETWREHSPGFPRMYIYKADYPVEYERKIRWHPSIHMPKKAARIFLRVTDVRLERLNDIDDVGIRAEGITPHNIGIPDTPTTLLSRYAALWNTTVTKKELLRYRWEANPWVWVIRFERVED